MWSTIVTNLLSNAVKYTPHGGIDIDLRADQDTAVLTVTDTGLGIAPEEQTRVFDRFHRAPQATTGVGAGIGLALVADLVRAHQGTVELTSAPDHGTTFTISVPRNQDTPAATRPRAGATHRGIDPPPAAAGRGRHRPARLPHPTAHRRRLARARRPGRRDRPRRCHRPRRPEHRPGAHRPGAARAQRPAPGQRTPRRAAHHAVADRHPHRPRRRRSRRHRHWPPAPTTTSPNPSPPWNCSPGSGPTTNCTNSGKPPSAPPRAGPTRSAPDWNPTGSSAPPSAS